VSGFLKHAVSVSLADVAGWGAMLGAALEQTGGALTAKERAWADSILRPARRSSARKTAAYGVVRAFARRQSGHTDRDRRGNIRRGRDAAREPRTCSTRSVDAAPLAR
jgi:hypothetical protein